MSANRTTIKQGIASSAPVAEPDKAAGQETPQTEIIVEFVDNLDRIRESS